MACSPAPFLQATFCPIAAHVPFFDAPFDSPPLCRVVDVLLELWRTAMAVVAGGDDGARKIDRPDVHGAQTSVSRERAHCHPPTPPHLVLYRACATRDPHTRRGRERRYPFACASVSGILFFFCFRLGCVCSASLAVAPTKLHAREHLRFRFALRDHQQERALPPPPSLSRPLVVGCVVCVYCHTNWAVVSEAAEEGEECRSGKKRILRQRLAVCVCVCVPPPLSSHPLTVVKLPELPC